VIRRMRVAIDGKRYYLNSSGIGRYSRSLIDQLNSIGDEENLELFLYRPKGKVKFEPKYHSHLTEITADYLFPGHIGNAIWRFTKLPSLINNNEYDLFHGPSHVLPGKLKCPSVVTMLDLIFIRYPNYFKAWDRNYYRISFKKSAQLADHIISISEATKADLINFFGIKEDKISVIYPGFDAVFSKLQQQKLDEIKIKFKLPRDYILYVGNIEPRKNILKLAQAFNSLQESSHIDKNVHLLIVGQKGWYYKEIIDGIDSLSSRDKIKLVGPVYGEDLVGVYQLATIMAYPSMFEGFGYPVLEAMRLGTPVLTSNISSMPEVGGNAAHYVNPESLDEIKDGLCKLLNDKNYREKLAVKGTRHAAGFNTMRMAQETLEVYRKLI